MFLSLREAPGHAVEESLFDVTAGNTHMKIGALGFMYLAPPLRVRMFAARSGDVMNHIAAPTRLS